MKFPNVYVILFNNTRGEIRALPETYKTVENAEREGRLIFHDARNSWFIGKVVDK